MDENTALPTTMTRDTLTLLVDLGADLSFLDGVAVTQVRRIDAVTTRRVDGVLSWRDGPGYRRPCLGLVRTDGSGESLIYPLPTSGRTGEAFGDTDFTLTLHPLERL